MADPQTVIEGTLKYRDNKKWKPRWCVIRKLSPVADCLHLQLYRDSKDRCKNGPTKASLSLEGFLGMETGFTLDKESNTMALICTEVVVVLAFDSRELLIQWQVKVRANLVEEHQFLVQIAYVPAKSKLASGPARLHLLDYMFCLTAGVPPKLLGIWPLRELRRFGVVDGKFCFEGGSRCGKGEGLHVLLTNQAKDLVQTFDMASRGRLPGKRKVSVRKNTSGVDGTTRSSLTGGSRPCSGVVTSENEKESSETSSESSTKPLLGSTGSDGSEVGKGVRPCHFHYRWPSCIVPCGAATRGEMTADEGARTLARSTMGGHGRTTDGQMLWAVGHCQGCGVHYCRRNAGNKENTAPATGEEPTGFTPQWTMDLGIVSPSADNTNPNVQTRTCSRNRTTKASPHDRSSLCSQSSQSSGTSTTSNTSSSSSSSMSEYSVPKNCLDSFYDRPKNVHHQSTPTTTFPYNRLSLTEDKDRLGPIREGAPCTCWKQQKTSDPASHELLLFGGGLLCSCWGRTNVDVDMPSVSSSGSSNASPSTSPKKQMPLVSVPILLPCTCGKVANNPYLNYAVPRPGTPVKVLKEELADKKSESGTGTSTAGDIQEAKIINKMDNSQLSTDYKENNGNVVGSSTSTKPQPAQPGYFQQPPVCSCQRLLLCPGSLLPSFNQTTPTDSTRRLVGRTSSDYGSVNPKTTSVVPSDNENSKRKAGTDHNLNCRCRQAPVVCPIPAPECGCGKIATLGMPFINPRVGRKDNANHIYVNLKYLQETAAAAMTGQSIPGKLIPYYANLHFLQTLQLYENAEILDVRPSHLMPNPFPDGTIPEDSDKVTEAIPKRHKKRIETPSNNGVYEMMSFNQSEFPSTSGGNYLLMQPGTSDNRELTPADIGAAPPVSTQGSITDASGASTSSSSVASSTAPENDAAVGSESILPLRPFMPVLLPFHDHTCDLKGNPECDDSCKSTCGRKCGGEYCRSSRSNSLGDIKVSLFRKGRSSSTDGRQEGSAQDELNCHYAGCSTASPKSTPRKHPLLTKLTLRSKEKSFSTDEITPPSSAPSSPDSLFLESIQKYPFHRSADCLQLNEEYRLSEEDLSQDPEVIMSQSMDKSSLTRTPVSIKRSSSVPCKANPNNQQQSQQHSASSTDSGISTHLPTTIGGQGAVFSHFIAYHGSLPRRHSGNAASRHPVPERKFSSGVGNKPPATQQDQKLAADQSKMILISECKQCYQFVTSPDGVLVLDTKSMTSSSSSDMSDYIESLSLCSRSSSGSASSGCGGVGASEYVRTDDLCNALMKIPTSCTSSLRPRSGKEYHSFDRVLIQEGCPYIPLTDCSHLNLPCLKAFTDETGLVNSTDPAINDNVPENGNNNLINNNNANKMNCPSPGYISSSPGNVEFISSPEKTNQFTFPKDSSKELNYLEVVSVGESEPSSPIVKQQGTVQYAVIDMVATTAARKLSTERAQLREGRSPTPTESSPKHHSCVDDASASDKK